MFYVPHNREVYHGKPLLQGPSNSTTEMGQKHCEVSCRVVVGHPAVPSSLLGTSLQHVVTQRR